jgi:hypothetical protein
VWTRRKAQTRPAGEGTGISLSLTLKSLRRAGWSRTGLLAITVAAAGCAITIPPPRSAPATPAEAETAWAAVLERFVDDRGAIDFAGLAKDSGDLDRYVAALAREDPQSGPESFPTRQDALAFYLNAYNALAMYGALRSGIPPELGSIKVRFFYRNRFELGGRRISLYSLENRVVRPMGDPRVHFALNCMVRGCPRLPREPFRGPQLDAELDRAAREFFAEERNVRLDPPRRRVFFSEILRFYTKDFLAKAPSLVAYANRYRSEPIPEDWSVEFLPYDWTLNVHGRGQS